VSDSKIDRRSWLGGGTLALSAALGASVCSPLRGGEPEDALESTIRAASAFGMRPGASPGENRKALQAAIDWAAVRGGAILIEPTDEPYAVESGLLLRQNASLLGVNAAVPRSTSHPQRRHPVGSVFRIESTDRPFLTVESATQVRGLQFWYPDQTVRDPGKVIEYPPTIVRDPDKPVFGVTMAELTFFGDFITFDFTSAQASAGKVTELMRFEHCFAYPLSGRFIDIDYCYDIPRVLHCHVNPAIRRLADGGYSRDVIDGVVDRKTFAYRIDHTDNAQLMDLFTFGTWGGIRLGPATYGQLTNFNLDCVAVGIHKSGDNQFNRNWQIAQGSIIANAAGRIEDNHPIIIDGMGHTSLTAVESFCGPNGALSTPSVEIDGMQRTVSRDYLLIEGSDHATVSLFGCRMSNYLAENPITNNTPNAAVAAYGCFARRGYDAHALPFEVLPRVS